MQPAGLRRVDLHDGHVDLIGVGRDAPLRAAETAAAARAVAPDLRPLSIRIERVGHARLLRDDDETPAVGE